MGCGLFFVDLGWGSEAAVSGTPAASAERSVRTVAPLMSVGFKLKVWRLNRGARCAPQAVVSGTPVASAEQSARTIAPLHGLMFSGKSCSVAGENVSPKSAFLLPAFSFSDKKKMPAHRLYERQ